MGDLDLPSPSDYHISPGAALSSPAKPTWSFSKGKWEVVEAQGPPSKTPGPGQYTVHPNEGAHIPHITCEPRRRLRQHPLYRGLPSPRAQARVPGMPSFEASLK